MWEGLQGVWRGGREGGREEEEEVRRREEGSSTVLIRLRSRSVARLRLLRLVFWGMLFVSPPLCFFLLFFPLSALADPRPQSPSQEPTDCFSDCFFFFFLFLFSTGRPCEDVSEPAYFLSLFVFFLFFFPASGRGWRWAGEGGGVVVYTMWSKLPSQRHVGRRCQISGMFSGGFWNRKAGTEPRLLLLLFLFLSSSSSSSHCVNAWLLLCFFVFGHFFFCVTTCLF